MTVQVCIVSGFGINTEREMALAFELAGARAACLHLNDLVAAPERLAGFGIFVVPGGFSFGDHIGSGAMLAALMARTLREPLAAFIQRGGLVLGVCNGFQVLVRMGLVPGLDGWAQSVALVHNDSGRFEDRWVEVRFDPASPCLWTRGIERLALPVRHGEGRLVAPENLLGRIDAAHLGAARYTTTAARADSESTSVPYPANPNGSLRNLADCATRAARCSGSCRTRKRSCTGIITQPGATPRRSSSPPWTTAPCRYSATPCAMPPPATPPADNPDSLDATPPHEYIVAYQTSRGRSSVG